MTSHCEYCDCQGLSAPRRMDIVTNVALQLMCGCVWLWLPQMTSQFIKGDMGISRVKQRSPCRFCAVEPCRSTFLRSNSSLLTPSFWLISVLLLIVMLSWHPQHAADAWALDDDELTGIWLHFLLWKHFIKNCHFPLLQWSTLPSRTVTLISLRFPCFLINLQHWNFTQVIFIPSTHYILDKRQNSGNF